MNRLVLLRHGRTEGTERHLYYGATDLPLLEDGVRELKDAARRGVYPAPGGFSFVTTGMRRTTETLPIFIASPMAYIVLGRKIKEEPAEEVAEVTVLFAQSTNGTGSNTLTAVHTRNLSQ